MDGKEKTAISLGWQEGRDLPSIRAEALRKAALVFGVERDHPGLSISNQGNITFLEDEPVGKRVKVSGMEITLDESVRPVPQSLRDRLLERYADGRTFTLMSAQTRLTVTMGDLVSTVSQLVSEGRVIREPVPAGGDVYYHVRQPSELRGDVDSDGKPILDILVMRVERRYRDGRTFNTQDIMKDFTVPYQMASEVMAALWARKLAVGSEKETARSEFQITAPTSMRLKSAAPPEVPKPPSWQFWRRGETGAKNSNDPLAEFSFTITGQDKLDGKPGAKTCPTALAIQRVLGEMGVEFKEVSCGVSQTNITLQDGTMASYLNPRPLQNWISAYDGRGLAGYSGSTATPSTFTLKRNRTIV